MVHPIKIPSWSWIIIIPILLIGIIFLLGPKYIKYLQHKGHAVRPIPTSSEAQQSKKIIKPNIPTDHNITTTVKGESEYNGPETHYKNGKFSPLEVKLKQDLSGFGCLLKIFNDDSSPLTIRLGPYEQSLKYNYGYKYPFIPGGGYMIIDPRFNRSREEFLDLAHPENKFYVNIDKSCLPGL